MTEAKRISLTTISNTVSSSVVFGVHSSSNVNFPSSSRFGGSVFGEQKADDDAKSKDPPSCRLELELFETDSTTYPEFNYSKLMHLEKKKIKKLKQRANNGMIEPYADKDEDVMRIVKELEDKYGADYKTKRSHTQYCDIGKGYDETDSFIDNTEAFDEVVPEEFEPIEGGFYINCGALQFKKLHTESTTTRTDEIIKMPNRPKKRILSSSSEDSSSSDDENEDENDEDDDDEDDDDDSGEETVVEVTKENNKNNHLEKKHKKATSSATTSTTTSSSASSTTSTSKKSKTNGKHKKENATTATITTTSISNSSSNSPKPPSTDEIGGESDKERMRQKFIKTTTVKDMIKAKRDNFLKRKVDASSNKLNGELKGAVGKSSEDETSSDDSDDDSDSKSESSDIDTNIVEVQVKKLKKTVTNNDEINEKLRTSETKLPDLESEVATNIQLFKDLAKSMNITEKKFQFDVKLTELLLKIDESLLCMDKTHRTMVFAHLEFDLLLPKSYLLRKAKQLRIKEEKTKTQRALLKFRKAVSSVMPAAIVNYDLELKKCAELDGVNIDSEHPPKMPKKKFAWNSYLRDLLFEVYQVRWTSFPVLGTRKEVLEDFINEYLRTKVLDIWPKGWMRYEEIQREIEKSKIALKKSKEKLKKKDNSGKITPTTTIVNIASQNFTYTAAAVAATTTATTNMLPTPISAPTPPPATSITITTTNATNSTFKKILDDSNSRSYNTSDTDPSVNVNPMNLLKRKNEIVKQNKSKSQKMNAAAPTTKFNNHTKYSI